MSAAWEGEGACLDGTIVMVGVLLATVVLGCSDSKPQQRRTEKEHHTTANTRSC